MKNETLTYAAYLANPAIRVRIEREARRERAEAVRRLIWMPLKALFARRPARAVRVMQVSAA